MKRTTTTILLGSTCLLILFPSRDLDAQTSTIAGRVTARATGAPLSGASVQVSSPALADSVGTTTDGEGRYAFKGLPEGTYAAEVTFVGYRTTTARHIDVGPGRPAIADFGLVSAPVELTETVVSASRRAENIVDAPISISKIRAEEIAHNTHAHSVASLLEHVRGIDYTQRGVLTEKYGARGFNTAAGPNSRMVVFRDGIPGGSSPAAAMELSVPKDDLQNVEVIVGPGSALYGPDAVSGVVSVTTKDPRGSEGTTVTLGGGSRSIFKGRFRHAGTRDKWGWKVSGEHQQARDYEVEWAFIRPDSTTAIDGDPSSDSWSNRGSLGLYYYRNPDSRIAFQAGAGAVDLIDLADTGRMSYGDWRKYTSQLTYSSSQSYLNIYRVQEDLGDTYNTDVKVRHMANGVPELEAKKRAKFTGDSYIWGGEFRRKYRFQPLRTHLTYGVDYRRAEYVFAFLEGGRYLARGLGVYGQSETGLSEHLKLVLAGRVDSDNRYDARFSPKLGLIYKPDPAMALRATFNRAFRSPISWQVAFLYPLGGPSMLRGNADGFRFGTVTGAPLPPQYESGIGKITPEENTTYELGFKGVLRNSVFLDVSAYESRYKGFISPLVPIGDPANGIFTLDEEGNPRTGEVTIVYLNFGRRTIHGLDVGVNAYPTDRLTLMGNLSLIRAGELKEPGALDLDEPFNTPEAIFNLGASACDFLTSGLDVSLSLRRVSEFDFRSGWRSGIVPSYSVVNLGLSYRLDPGVTCRLTVRNLLDNKHIEVVDGFELGRLAVAEIGYEL